jgi:transposase
MTQSQEPPSGKKEEGPSPLPPAKNKKGKKRSKKSRPVTEEDRQEILRLASETRLGQREIAKHVGLSRRQVRRVVEEKKPTQASGETGEPPAKPPEPQTNGSLLVPYRLAIEERVQKGLTASRILREIQAEGYRGGRTILAEAVRELRAKLRVPRRKLPKRRFETLPAEETQIDFGTYTVPIGGIPTTVQAFVCELAYSRKGSIHVFRDQRQATVFEGLDGAFSDFEGVSEFVVPDNMTTIVLGRTQVEPGKREPILHPNAIAYAKHYDFKWRPCEYRHPDRKGKDESLVGFFERDCIRGSSFESWEDLRRHVREWYSKANKRKHGTTGLVPDEVWQTTERELLARLPAERFSVHHHEPRAVGPDSTLSIGGTLYTVPCGLANTVVTVRLFAHRFEVVDPAGKIAFSRGYVDPRDKGKLQLDPTHYASLPKRRGQGRGTRKRLDETVRARFPTLGPLVDGIARRMKTLAPIHYGRLLRLASRYGERAFLAAALRVQEAKRYDALAVQRVLEREQPLADEAPLPLLGGAGSVLLADVDEGSLDGYARLDDDPARPEEDDHGS